MVRNGNLSERSLDSPTSIWRRLGFWCEIRVPGAGGGNRFDGSFSDEVTRVEVRGRHPEVGSWEWLAEAVEGEGTGEVQRAGSTAPSGL